MTGKGTRRTRWTWVLLCAAMVVVVATLLSGPRPRQVAAIGEPENVVSGGGFFTCALTPLGGATCWGFNSEGQLGDGTTTSHLTPSDVTGLTSGVTSVTAGFSHACALAAQGGLKCWGDNFLGELGDGQACGTAFCVTPVDVVGLTNAARAVSAGDLHTCALTAAGGVKCWGNNIVGQLGDGTTTNRLTPVDVVGLTSGVAAIAAGGTHTCALTSAGGVKCWGSDMFGQMAAATTELCSRFDTPCSTVPVDASGLTNGVAAIAAGGAHTCALTTAGGVKCWGSNSLGELGNGTTTSPGAPVAVVGLSSGVTAIAAGGFNSCGLTTASGVKCWGINRNGQLGTPTGTCSLVTLCSSTPVDVTGLSGGVAAIAVGSSHSCALMNTMRLKCWGSNAGGQLGDGTTTDSTTPVDVAGANPKLVGGLAVDLDDAHERGSPLQADDSASRVTNRFVSVIAAITSAVVALGGAAWYAKRRKSRKLGPGVAA